MKTIKRQGVAVDKLAQKIANRRSTEKAYNKGNEQEKVWINFQVTKGLKRDFSDICSNNHVNASAFLRGAIKLLIHYKGDASKALLDIKKQLED